MNQNLIIGALVAVVIVGGGYFLLNSNSLPVATNVTLTPPAAQDTTNNPTSNPAPSASAPNVVTDAVVAPSNSTAVVTGNVTPNGAPTAYWYEYGEATTPSNRTSSQTVGSGWNAIPSPGYITGLRANTLYYFRLSAQNAYGTVNGTTNSFSTHSNPPLAGSAPAVKTSSASGISRTSANLVGDVTPNKASTQYWFEYGMNGELGNITAFVSIGNGSASMPVSVAISNLEPATTYYYRVNAQNEFGTVNGAILTFKTAGPAASVAPVVTTQVASPVARTSATVRGTVNTSGTQTTYWFEYSTDSGFVTASLKTTSHKSAGAGTNTVSVEANISGLKSGTTYYYRVVAQNSAGTVRADSLSFTTN